MENQNQNQNRGVNGANVHLNQQGGNNRPPKSPLELLLQNNMGAEPVSAIYNVTCGMVEDSLRSYFATKGVNDVMIRFKAARTMLQVYAIFRTDDPVLTQGKGMLRRSSLLIDNYEQTALTISLNKDFSEAVERFIPRNWNAKYLSVVEEQPEFCFIQLDISMVLRYCLSAFRDFGIDIVNHDLILNNNRKNEDFIEDLVFEVVKFRQVRQETKFFGKLLSR